MRDALLVVGGIVVGLLGAYVSFVVTAPSIVRRIVVKGLLG